MCWQRADSLSYNVGMGHLDSGSFKVASGSGTGGFLKNQTALASGRIPRGMVTVFFFQTLPSKESLLAMVARCDLRKSILTQKRS